MKAIGWTFARKSAFLSVWICCAGLLTFAYSLTERTSDLLIVFICLLVNFFLTLIALFKT